MIKIPDVSIILPAYNASSEIERSLRSLMDQTYTNIEIIVVNDASTDNTKEIINRLSLEDERIVLIDLKDNLGVHEARLAGLKTAKGKWIGFLDADDFAKPKMFELMLKQGTKKQVDIVICGSNRVTQKRKYIQKIIRFKKSKAISEDVFKKFSNFEFGTGALWNKLYKRDVIVPYVDMVFPWRQNTNEDLLLNIGCFINANKVYVMREILHEYIYNQSSVTSNIDKNKAFVDTYSAYAIALKFFNNEHGHIVDSIIDMYRKQLSWDCYQVDEISQLYSYDCQLIKATSLINENYPLGLSMGIARNFECNGINKKTLKKIGIFAIKKYLIRV